MQQHWPAGVPSVQLRAALHVLQLRRRRAHAVSTTLEDGRWGAVAGWDGAPHQHLPTGSAD